MTDAPAPERTWFLVCLPPSGCTPGPVGPVTGAKTHLYLAGDGAGISLVLRPRDSDYHRISEADFYEYAIWTPRRTVDGSGLMEKLNEALIRAELVEMLDGLLKTAGPRPVGGSH